MCCACTCVWVPIFVHVSVCIYTDVYMCADACWCVHVSMHIRKCVHGCVFMHVYVGMAGGHVHVHMPYLRSSQDCVQVKQATTLMPSKRHLHWGLAVCVCWMDVKRGCHMWVRAMWSLAWKVSGPAFLSHKPEIVQTSQSFLCLQSEKCRECARTNLFCILCLWQFGIFWVSSYRGGFLEKYFSE